MGSTGKEEIKRRILETVLQRKQKKESSSPQFAKKVM